MALGPASTRGSNGGASESTGSNGVTDHSSRVRDKCARIALEMLVATDPGTAAHSGDVELLVSKLCERLGVGGEERQQIEVAGRLHDIGKIALPRQVLDKPGPLDETEWELVRGHTVAGERILSSVPELATVAHLVRRCHEHFDGSGYPDGLRGEEIPFGSRIILCADAFQAIRTDRHHRPGRPTSEALAEMEAHSGGQFDPSVVAALSRSVARARWIDDRWMSSAPLDDGAVW
jgi:HD-GYP domain-containing protein (c-di-GMP phosphodiesterase class II)